MILILSQLLAELAKKCQADCSQSISTASRNKDTPRLALFTVS